MTARLRLPVPSPYSGPHRWGLANLSLDSLTDNAQQADEYRLKGE